MSWDFSTDPDFQEQLDWMGEFVRQEIWPLEAIWHELGSTGCARALAPLQEQVKAARAVGRPPAARARRPGHGPGAPRPDARDPRHLADRAARVRQRRARLGQLRDPRARRHRPSRRTAGCTRCSPGDLRSAFSMTEPHTPGSDPTQLAHARRARRRRTG